jgi:hypothetical protein
VSTAPHVRKNQRQKTKDLVNAPSISEQFIKPFELKDGTFRGCQRGNCFDDLINIRSSRDLSFSVPRLLRLPEQTQASRFNYLILYLIQEHDFPNPQAIVLVLYKNNLTMW